MTPLHKWSHIPGVIYPEDRPAQPKAPKPTPAPLPRGSKRTRPEFEEPRMTLREVMSLLHSSKAHARLIAERLGGPRVLGYCPRCRKIVSYYLAEPITRYHQWHLLSYAPRAGALPEGYLSMDAAKAIAGSYYRLAALARKGYVYSLYCHDTRGRRVRCFSAADLRRCCPNN